MGTNSDGPDGHERPGEQPAGRSGERSRGARPGGAQSPDLLARLQRTNPAVVVFAALGLFLGVLLLPDVVGAVLIVAIAGALLWLLRHTWPVLTPSARTARLGVIALLLLVALARVAF